MLDLHGKILKLAKSRSAEWTLAIVSFSESIFFPIPPDTLVIPMVLANQKRALKIAFIATFFSVFGGIIGYLIGLFFFEEIGYRLIVSLGLSEQFTLFKEILEQYGYLFIFVSFFLYMASRRTFEGTIVGTRGDQGIQLATNPQSQNPGSCVPAHYGAPLCVIAGRQTNNLRLNWH